MKPPLHDLPELFFVREVLPTRFGVRHRPERFVERHASGGEVHVRAPLVPEPDCDRFDHRWRRDERARRVDPIGERDCGLANCDIVRVAAERHDRHEPTKHRVRFKASAAYLLEQ